MLMLMWRLRWMLRLGWETVVGELLSVRAAGWWMLSIDDYYDWGVIGSVCSPKSLLLVFLSFYSPRSYPHSHLHSPPSSSSPPRHPHSHNHHNPPTTLSLPIPSSSPHHLPPSPPHPPPLHQNPRSAAPHP